ncbi:MAG TPA: signal recognition particle-docking protein FtsY [Candidatus Acidoferrum sp.]|nr:signal recognition particle-docking protein FtsY [Candidatus Acidoferrum sp.]
MFGFGKRPKTEADPAASSASDTPPADAPKAGFFSRLKAGLSRTRETLAHSLGNLLLGKKAIDQALLDELETQLLTADVGIKATASILGELTARVKRNELADSDALYGALKQLLQAMLQPCEAPLAISTAPGKPFVILMVGVNGVGKTTTIGKLAKRFQGEGRSVMLAAGDTFRAAAVEQLQVWGERNHVPVVAQHTGADSASVIFDAYQSAVAKKVDVLIADTAGRLHTKNNLMQELEKVVRVLKKLDPDIPHETLLVLDATTGQNALSQARSFTESVKVSGIVLSKLDGTARGGMVFAIANELGLPLRFIGVGEKADDLRPFVAQDFVNALFASGTEE